MGPSPVMLPSGVYTRKGKPYWLIGLARMHENGDEYVAYVPLYTRPEFAGTPSMSLRPLAEFLAAFEWAGARIPDAQADDPPGLRARNTRSV